MNGDDQYHYISRPATRWQPELIKRQWFNDLSNDGSPSLTVIPSVCLSVCLSHAHPHTFTALQDDDAVKYFSTKVTRTEHTCQ